VKPVVHTCRVCSADLKSVWSVVDAKSAEQIEMALCDHCGLVQQANMPSDEALAIYYSHHYREDYKSAHQPSLKHVHRAGNVALDRLRFIEASGIQAQGQRLVDIGAGGGEFCFMAKQKGFDVLGIEPHHGYSEFARDQYGIQINTLGIADIPDQSADVVTLFHVLEHLAHPVQAMEKVWSILRPGGRFVIEVPNIHQADASPHNIYFKAHLFYYSRYSLAAAASRFFDVERLEDQGNLYAVLRRKAVALPELVLPTPAEVAHTRERLAQKGWLEYLTVGGGWKKPFKRLKKLQAERQIAAHSAKSVLEALI
jgi:2-polyprenyl-3-methyl-5-hydroxy-6-metoxy-1,4-benzoquinol methylase